MNALRSAVAVVLLAISGSAIADTSVLTNVQQVSAVNMPGSFAIATTVTGLCWLTYANSSPDNTKANFAVALSAELSGTPVYVTYNPTTCQISYMSLYKQ
jgi:hypothetical protein